VTRGRMASAVGLALLLLGCEREERMVREDLPMARATKARADVQSLAAAVNTYRASCGGAFPESLEALTTLTTVEGAPCGPVLGSIPSPPAGWSAYAYRRDGDAFTVTSTSGAQTVSAP
jgi:Type II secretion system (T2SS), protein G